MLMGPYLPFLHAIMVTLFIGASFASTGVVLEAG